MRIILALALLAAACAGSTQPQPIEAPRTATPSRTVEAFHALLAAETQLSTAEGLQAFGESFDENVVLFAPPVPGFASGRTQAVATLARALEADAPTLQLTTIRTGVAADGAHGFTFGYASATRPGASAYLGKYVAFWTRGADGWRIRLFKLVPRPEGEVSTDRMAHWLSPAGDAGTSAERTRGFEQELAAREQAFSDDARTNGLGPAFARFGREDAVNVGGDASFTVSAQAIAAIHPDGPSGIVWSADQGVIVSSSGDLGVTWGYLRRVGPTPPGRLAEIPFFTIWARDSAGDPWLYIAE